MIYLIEDLIANKRSYVRFKGSAAILMGISSNSMADIGSCKIIKNRYRVSVLRENEWV